jgi:hypothetical protein
LRVIAIGTKKKLIMKTTIKFNGAEKNIDRIMNDNIETIFYLLKKQGTITLQMSSFMETVKDVGFAKYMKSVNLGSYGRLSFVKNSTTIKKQKTR